MIKNPNPLVNIVYIRKVKKTFFLCPLLLVLIACSPAESKKENKRHARTYVWATLDTVVHQPREPLVLTELNDSVLIARLMPHIEYIQGVGFVYGKDYLKDTGHVTVISRDTVAGPRDTLYYFGIQSPEYYQHGHTLYDQDGALLQKKGKTWVVTDTLQGFVFDPEGQTTVQAVGNYFIMTDVHAGSYWGGMYEAGEWFTVIYDGKVIDGMGYLSVAGNGAGEGCMPPEEPDPDWECNCYSKTGKGGFSIDTRTGVLLLNKEETVTQYLGNRCQDSTATTKIETLAFYKSYSKLIVEKEISGRKKEVRMNMPVKTFLREAKQALGEK